MSKNTEDVLMRAYSDSIRHTKFRGQLLGTGETVYGGFFQHSKVLLCPVGITEEDIENNTEYLIATTVLDEEGKESIKLHQVDPSTVSLFTNKYDKDNKEIYTGDTVVYVNKEFVVKYRLGDFYLYSTDKQRPLRGIKYSKLRVLSDRPVQPSCLNLDHLGIKAKAIHNDTWYRGGCSYDENLNQMNVLLNNGLSDWNLPAPISAMRVKPDTCELSLGILDEDGTSAYTGDIVEFTEDIILNPTTHIKKNTRAVIIRLPGEVCIRTSEILIPMQDLITEGNKLINAVIVNNIHDLEVAK